MQTMMIMQQPCAREAEPIEAAPMAAAPVHEEHMVSAAVLGCSSPCSRLHERACAYRTRSGACCECHCSQFMKDQLWLDASTRQQIRDRSAEWLWSAHRMTVGDSRGKVSVGLQLVLPTKAE